MARLLTRASTIFATSIFAITCAPQRWQHSIPNSHATLTIIPPERGLLSKKRFCCPPIAAQPIKSPPESTSPCQFVALRPTLRDPLFRNGRHAFCRQTFFSFRDCHLFGGM